MSLRTLRYQRKTLRDLKGPHTPNVRDQNRNSVLKKGPLYCPACHLSPSFVSAGSKVEGDSAMLQCKIFGVYPSRMPVTRTTLHF